MGDLRSKLRAKISRRHSGIPLLTSSKSGGSHSVQSSPSVEPSSPASTNRVDFTENVSGTQGSSHSPQAAEQPDGQLRQDRKKQPAPVPSEVSGASSGGNVAVEGAGSAAASQEPGSPSAAKATNSSLPPMPASAGPGSNVVHGKDRRPPSAGEGSGDHQSPADAGQQLSSPSSTTRPAPVDAPKPSVSTDAARRVRLSDPPTSSTCPSRALDPLPLVPRPPPSKSRWTRHHQQTFNCAHRTRPATVQPRRRDDRACCLTDRRR